ncbi:hypothetical protein XELAEV_18045262mg [Xenopus laevis]|uniref:Uncharacterized protein n=1 Tax=Xenopus laevis TaxID=8355 RepID=A0A974C0P6_XENLA|nr:hypothetical protein XELAEV_18045262mg [Xenopus laevis]
MILLEVRGQPFPAGTGDWIPELNLTQQHKMSLRGTEFLDDKIIDAAHSLLKIQPSVQIHYNRVENQWLTSCFKNHHVQIADSAEIKHHYISLRKQINKCYSELVYDPEGTMEIIDVDEQANAYDDGIDNAFEFLCEGNPIYKYDQKKMRRHLIRCFNRRKFTAFPKKTDACVVDVEPKVNFTWLYRK